jgi:hypothetical protein
MGQRTDKVTKINFDISQRYIIFVMLIDHIMKSKEIIIAPKIDAFPPYGVIDKPSIVGALYILS